MNKSRRMALFTTPLVVMLVAGCSGSQSGTTTHTSAISGGHTPAAPTSAELEKLYHGTYQRPPTTSPTPQPGKKIAIISITQASGIAAEASSGAKAAASALGWTATVFDGKGDPNELLAGVRQAITQKVDAIVLVYIDCSYVRQGLEQARQAGIKIVALESSDCSDLGSGAPSLFDYVTSYVEGPYRTWAQAYGEAQALWLINATNQQAKVIDLVENDVQATVLSDRGFRAKLKECGACKVVDTVEFTQTDLGPALQEKVQQALLKHPEANALLASSYDAVVTSGAAAAIRASGRTSKLKVMGGEGEPENLRLIRSGQGQDAGVGFPSGWEAYAALDALNRLFHGEDPKSVSTGIGLQIFDRTHNLGASGPYVATDVDGHVIDYAALYERAWRAGS